MKLVVSENDRTLFVSGLLHVYKMTKEAKRNLVDRILVVRVIHVLLSCLVDTLSKVYSVSASA